MSSNFEHFIIYYFGLNTVKPAESATSLRVPPA